MVHRCVVKLGGDVAAHVYWWYYKRLKLVLIPHALPSVTVCAPLCTGLRWLADRRNVFLLARKTPVNVCLSGGGGEHLEILGGINVIRSTFPTEGPQILVATMQNLVARDLCSAGLGRQFLAILYFQIPLNRGRKIQSPVATGEFWLTKIFTLVTPIAI
jgi:hypothetical protein